jgi:hypothetical protein
MFGIVYTATEVDDLIIRKSKVQEFPDVVSKA